MSLEVGGDGSLVERAASPFIIKKLSGGERGCLERGASLELGAWSFELRAWSLELGGGGGWELGAWR